MDMQQTEQTHATVDLESLCRLHQATLGKKTVLEDVVTDLMLCRFLLGQVQGRAKTLKYVCPEVKAAEQYLKDRGYLG